MKLSLFKSFRSKQPVSSSLDAVTKMIREDERIKSLTDAFRTTRDKTVKESSPLFGVAACFEGGKAKDQIRHLTGLSLVDVDHIGTSTNAIEALRQKAVADPHTLLCYLTISGEGLRIIFRYELDDSFPLAKQMQWYPKAFAAGNAYYAQLLGVPTDLQCKNVGRLSGMAHDPMVYLNTDAVAFTVAEIEAHSAREVERQRASKVQLREMRRLKTAYELTVKPEVEAEGAMYAPGCHNDYVMRVGYKLNQLGFAEAVATEWAAEMFPDYEQTEAVIHACYLKTEEFGTRNRNQGRRRDGSSGEHSGLLASVTDIRQFLTDHAQLRHNVITGRVEVASPDWTPITDRSVNSLWAEMSKTQRVNVQDIYRVIESDFVPEFHPFKAYLERVNNEELRVNNEELRVNNEELRVNNEELRIKSEELKVKSYHAIAELARAGSSSAIAELARTVTVRGGEAEQERFETYLRKWFVGMVATWVDDNVVNNVILVLIGEQGTYKTTWFNYLLPPELRRYFLTKTNANRMGRDDLLALSQYGLICCEELDTMRPAELNQLKAAVTMPTIDERAAYAHFHEHRKHIASFCGTGNNIQFLGDPTGNRRWLPFEVESIRSPREQPFDYEGIYAEAYSLYRNGFQFWFSREEIQLLNEYNHHFETPRLERELVQEHFRIPMDGERGEFMSVATALQIIGGNISQKLSPVHVGRAFRELGFEQKKVKQVRGYVVVQYTAEEIRQRRLCAAKI